MDNVATNRPSHNEAGMHHFLRDFHAHCTRPRLFAAGRLGPRRETPTGTTLRLVAVVNTAAIKITTVQPPQGPRAA